MSTKELILLIARYRFWSKYNQEHGGFESAKMVTEFGDKIDRFLSEIGVSFHMKTNIEYFNPPENDTQQTTP